MITKLAQSILNYSRINPKKETDDVEDFNVKIVNENDEAMLNEGKLIQDEKQLKAEVKLSETNVKGLKLYTEKTCRKAKTEPQELIFHRKKSQANTKW